MEGFELVAIELPGGAVATFTWDHSWSTLKPVSLEGATATASVNGAEAGRAIDADGSTVWQTKQAQAPGQWLQVDLGSARQFRELALDSGGQAGEYAASRQVATSNDGVDWSAPVTGRSTGQLTTVELRQTRARYLRVTSTATSDHRWSLADLRLYR